MSHIRFRGRLACLSVSSLALAAAPIQVAMAQDSDQAVRPDVVTVIGYGAQNAEAIGAKRESERVIEVLSSDDIGQQPDYNIADSFRRLPGVQTVFDEDEGRYVSIRGLNPSYTLGTFDGATMANAERGNRQLNMEAIPSTAVKRVEVVKSRTPDSDGNAIGGTVNLVSRSAFDHTGLYIAGNAFLGTSDSQDVPGEGYGRDRDDSLNFRADGTISTTFGDAEQFGVLFSGSWSQKHRDQERLLPQAIPAAITQNPQPATTAFGATDLLWSTYPNSVDRYGGILKLEYRPSAAIEAGASFTFFQQVDNELRHSQRLRNGTGANASFVRFNDYPIEKPLLVASTWGVWTPDEDNRLQARLSYSEATFSEPSNELLFRLNSPAATFDIELNGEVPVATNIDPRFNNPANYAFTSYTPYEDDSDEYVEEVSIDWSHNSDPGDQGWGFGAGGKVRNISRDNDRNQILYTGFTGAPLTLAQFDVARSYKPIYGNFPHQFIDFAAFETFFQQNRAGFIIDQLNTNRQTIGSDWVVDESVNALYGFLRHAGERHTVIFGGRFEQTETDVQRYSRTATGGASVNDFRLTRQNGEYENFLPSVTFSYDLTQTVKLRLAAAQAVGRPNLSSLGGSETIAADGTISRGNADLRAREGDTIEGALEYYFPGDQGLIAIAFFSKSIDNEIVTRTTNEEINGVLTNVNQPVNADTAKVEGVELSLVKNRLDFLPGPLSNLGFSANLTFLDGETTASGVTLGYLQGQADFLGNLALFYEDGPFRARATYAYVDELFTSSNRKDKHTNQLDLQARYEFGDGLELIGEIRNASNENKVNYFGENFDIVRDVSFYGRQFWLGVAYRN